MKYLLIAMLLIGSAKAQEKKDNTIIVHNANFDKAVSKLMDAGYHLDQENTASENKWASTKPNITGQIIYIRMKGDDLYITSEMNAAGMVIPIVYWKSSARWKDLMEYAGQFENIEFKRL